MKPHKKGNSDQKKKEGLLIEEEKGGDLKFGGGGYPFSTISGKGHPGKKTALAFNLRKDHKAVQATDREGATKEEVSLKNYI